MRNKAYNQERLEQISELLTPIFSAVKPAIGNAIAIVIGATGDGKSTLMNYLSGCTYVSQENDLGNITAQLSPQSKKEVCIVGKNPHESQTRHPQVLVPDQESNASFLYCDLPGFFDSGKEAEVICSLAAPEILKRSATSIKGIMWVLNLNQFEVNKGESIKKILNYLLSIAKGDADLIVESLAIVITRANKNTKIENVLSRFQGLMSVIDDKEQKNLFNKIIDRIKSTGANVIISNIFDQSGNNRILINETIETLKERNTDDFDFSHYSPIQEEFYDYLFEAAQLFVDNIQQSENSLNYLKTIEDKIDRRNQKYSQLEAELENYHLQQKTLLKQQNEVTAQLEHHLKAIGALEQEKFLQEFSFSKEAEMIPGFHGLQCGPMDYNSPIAMTNRGNAIANCYAQGYTHAEYNNCIYAVVPPKPKAGEATHHLVFPADYPVSAIKKNLNPGAIIEDGTEKSNKGYEADITYQIGKGLEINMVFEVETKNTPEGEKKLLAETQLKNKQIQKNHKLEQKKDELAKNIFTNLAEQEQIKIKLMTLQQLKIDIGEAIQQNQTYLKNVRGFFQSVHNLIVVLKLNADWVTQFIELFNIEKKRQDYCLRDNNYGFFQQAADIKPTWQWGDELEPNPELLEEYKNKKTQAVIKLQMEDLDEESSSSPLNH